MQLSRSQLPSRVLGFVLLVIAGACAGGDVDPIGVMHRPVAPLKSGGLGAVNFTVQGITTRGFEFWNVPGSSCSRDSVRVYQPPAVDRYVKFWAYCKPVDAPSPYNGGWINVFSLDGGAATYLGQVYGDLTRKVFDYDGPYATIRLDAYGDAIQGCSFEGFENYSPGVNSITVTGQGVLPLAYFHCP